MHFDKAIALLPICGTLALTACGRGGAGLTDSRATAANATSAARSAKAADTATAAPRAITVYKVTKELLVEGVCEADKATPPSQPLAPFVVIGPNADLVDQWLIAGCADASTCEQDGKRRAAGESASAMYMMPLNERGPASSTGGIYYGGKHENGKCTGVHEERVLFTESGSKGRLETRDVVYQDYDEADASYCSAAFATKRNVKDTCRKLRIMELEKVSAP